MTALAFDTVGARYYENGVDHAVLYPFDVDFVAPAEPYPLGVAWNGITAITESPSGGEATPLYADNIKYLNLVSLEELGLTIEAYTYPDEFALCDGTAEVATVVGTKLGQQSRGVFGLSFRTKLGSDTDPDKGYKLHLVYGCVAAPSEKGFGTINESPEAITFSWEVKTTPVAVTDVGAESFKPVAQIIIDSVTADADCLALLEAALYGTTGTPGTPPYLPLPDDVITMMTPTP